MLSNLWYSLYGYCSFIPKKKLYIELLHKMKRVFSEEQSNKTGCHGVVSY